MLYWTAKQYAVCAYACTHACTYTVRTDKFSIEHTSVGLAHARPIIKHADKLQQLQISGSVNNVATESGGGAYVSSNVVSIEQMPTGKFIKMWWVITDHCMTPH